MVTATLNWEAVVSRNSKVPFVKDTLVNCSKTVVAASRKGLIYRISMPKGTLAMVLDSTEFHSQKPKNGGFSTVEIVSIGW